MKHYLSKYPNRSGEKAGSSIAKKLATLQYTLGTVEVDSPQEKVNKPKNPLCPICGKEMILIGVVGPDYFTESIQQKPP